MEPLNLIHLQGMSIFEQLQLEEALLRTSDENWCVINEGSPPAIVMGISAKPHELIKPGVSLPIIKRFSGGGTVVVDEDTLFISFIFRKEAHDFTPFPEPIHRWCESFYKKIFTFDDFALRENDYVLGDKKFGGNAQYIKKDRWLHHTTFLWDYNQAHMEALLLPERAPLYRLKRNHSDFLCRLKDRMPAKEDVLASCLATLTSMFAVQSVDWRSLRFSPHRTATSLISVQDKKSILWVSEAKSDRFERQNHSPVAMIEEEN